MKELLSNKKVRIVIILFVVFIIIVSILFVIFNPAKENTGSVKGNEPGTDYVQPDTIEVGNNYIFYKYLGDSNTNAVTSLLKSAVIYNVSISNDPNASKDYTQSSGFNTRNMKLYNKGKLYNVTIDDSKINSANGVPWNYWFGLTVDDGRKFRLDINADPENSGPIISIKKTN